MDAEGRTGSRGPGPRLTVVVPVLDGAGVLDRSLGALEASDLDRTRWEAVVVDDGSRDGTADIARSRGHRVVRLDAGPLGPAAARNAGAREARGDILVFVDADVCVHSDALRRFDGLLENENDVGAVFGAYDDRPSDPRFLSQYRNLYHRWVHLRGAGEAETFWAGCGAVRRRLFLDLGGFDAVRFSRPRIEDIELGYRIRDAGWRILLDPAIQATHLKRWTFPSMIRTDLLDRGIPWVRLLLSRPRKASLNVAPEERIRTALVGLACLLLLVAAVRGGPGLAATAVLPLAAVTLSNLGLLRWFAGLRGGGFALGVVPLNLMYYFVSGVAVVVGWLLHVATREAS